MKKLLSIVLAASMVFGSAGFAMAAPADVEGTKYEDAVNRLQALEILNGYEDGTFKPEKTITRAEFAKIMVTTLGVGDAAKYANGETKFNDVPANHWAAGYVNVASDMGIINGYGDGNFGPSDEVTYAQAITMIVRGLGYEPKAKALGGYPGGYIAIASEKDITDDVKVVNSISANRGDVAIMVDNSLDVAMMVQTSFGKDPEWEEDENKTILSDKHDIEKITGYIKETPKTDSALDANEFKFAGETKAGKKVNDTFEMLVDGSVDNLIGVEVTIWANDDEEVFFIEKETDEDDIKYDAIEKFDGDKIFLEKEDEDYDLAKEVKVTINFEEGKEVSDVKDLVAKEELVYGYVVLNDAGDVSAINVVYGEDVANGVVTKVTKEGVEYVDADTAQDERDIDFSDYEDGVVFLDEKLNEISKDAIKENSAIYAFEEQNDDDLDKLYVVVSNNTVTGELQRVKTDELKIEGKKYDTAQEVTYSTDNNDDFDLFNGNVEDLDDLNGEEVTAVLDLSGDVILVTGDVQSTSDDMYGIVTYGDTGSKSEATIYGKDDNETEYKFEERSEGTKLDGVNYYGELTGKVDGKGTLQFGVIEYSLNSDGEIAEDENKTSIVTLKDENKTVDGEVVAGINVSVEGDASTATGTLTKDADEDKVMVKTADGNTKFYITEDTVMMTALDDNELDPSTVTYKNIYESDITKNNEVLVIGEAGKDADMIVFLNNNFEGTDDDYFYGVVTDGPSKAGDDYMITIDIAGKGEKEVKIDEDDKAKFAEGAVVEFKYNSKGELDFSTERKAVTVTIDPEAKDADGNRTDLVDYDDGYIEFTAKKTGLDKSVKVAKNVVVYKTDKDGDLDGTSKITKIDNYKNIKLVLDEDGMVSAVVLSEEI